MRDDKKTSPYNVPTIGLGVLIFFCALDIASRMQNFIVAHSWLHTIAYHWDQFKESTSAALAAHLYSVFGLKLTVDGTEGLPSIALMLGIIAFGAWRKVKIWGSFSKWFAAVRSSYFDSESGKFAVWQALKTILRKLTIVLVSVILFVMFLMPEGPKPPKGMYPTIDKYYGECRADLIVSGDNPEQIARIQMERRRSQPCLNIDARAAVEFGQWRQLRQRNETIGDVVFQYVQTVSIFCVAFLFEQEFWATVVAAFLAMAIGRIDVGALLRFTGLG